MKTVINIARVELKTLFYSPVAWFILTIFTVQVSLDFGEIFGWFMQRQSENLGDTHYSLALFSIHTETFKSLFPRVQGYIYIYIPLLTMGLMSREINSGSIKLLLSSPVTPVQVTLGKFFSMMMYGLLLMIIICIPVLFAHIYVKDLDIGLMSSGLMGIYFLICTYTAIGLFMSSLTSYQAVAAISTLAMLAAFNYVGGLWQEFDFVRDITSWLYIPAHADRMIDGLMVSEDILYFFIIITIFLGFTVVKLDSGKVRKKQISAARYILIVIVGITLGYLSSRPSSRIYLDTTATKDQTLSKESQELLSKMEGGLKITTYFNLFNWNFNVRGFPYPGAVNKDKKRYEPYLRFKPETELNYVYYWDTLNQDITLLRKNNPDESAAGLAEMHAEEFHNLDFGLFLKPDEIRNRIDLSEEGGLVTIIERENGQKSFSRFFMYAESVPDEAEISAALQRTVTKASKIGFITGHGERDIYKSGDREYSAGVSQKNYSYSLINQGFDIDTINLSAKNIDSDIDIVVISDIQTALSPVERARMDAYINKGGNVLIAAEPKNGAVVSSFVEQLGVNFTEEINIKENKDQAPTLISAALSPNASDNISCFFKKMQNINNKGDDYVVSMPGTMGINHNMCASKGFTIVPILQTKGGQDSIAEPGLGLTRNIADKQQRIAILGDADCFSNSEMALRYGRFNISQVHNNIYADNLDFFLGLFHWLSHGKAPFEITRPAYPDNKIYMQPTAFEPWKILFTWIIPAIILIVYLIIWIKRRNS